MSKVCRILIQVPDRSNAGSFNDLYRNTITLPDGVRVPFDNLIESFKILYPQDGEIINFSIL